MKFYEEFSKYIKVNVFRKMAGSRLNVEDYYPTMASCKFYLSFENSIHRDYITEKFNGPLSVGTVPVVLGPPRQNYKDFAPGDSFIHVNDFHNASVLADYLIKLDKDEEAYRRYFDWRKHVSATPHLIKTTDEFLVNVCTACDHIARHKEYKVAHDIYTWYFS
ncbi:4-galactosyl-N-acetylglucosaminide 3-alpha-L-fucosyltransferase 9-like [Brachyhypopomus gauderio]|uniref:4-galactosyl-N-acetylglucosaminide 3-alpha-L-fucosyltransferase 9-like n=1 Tax=Brachyhypopomus gauderio TaxID=698409 RepID=UPI0040436A77